MSLGDVMFKFIRKLITSILSLILLAVALVCGIGYMSYSEVIEEEPIELKVFQLQNQWNYVAYEDISPNYVNALIAIEDERFLTHGGVDYIALIRTTIANIRAKELLGGGSTITQQLAKNLYFMDSTSLTRKISEAFVAYELEKLYSKEEILELYANVVYFGDNYYGIYDASMGYFKVEPSALSLGQASMLAGLPQAPSVYALSNNNPASYRRQEEVLKAMLKNDFISTDELVMALREELK